MPEKTTSPWALPYPTSVGEVKNGATNIEELAVKLNTTFNEKFLVFKTYAAGATLKSGEYAIQTKNGETFTLPSAATANQIIGVLASGITEAKVTTSGGAVIYGAYVSPGVATIKLASAQTVILQSDGTNWLIVAGEPKREQKYSAVEAFSQAEGEAGITPSATRPATIVMWLELEAAPKLGGRGMPIVPAKGAVTYKVNPGQAVVVKSAGTYSIQVE